MAPGETLAILKYEQAGADEAFDDLGLRVAMPSRTDEQVSLYVERGLTDRLTLQGKLGWTRGEDAFVAYEGRGPVELGLRYAVLRGDRSVVSLYAGAVLAGEGRNAGYAAPGAGTADLEARLLAGRSGAFRGQPVFAEVQLARLDRSGLPDETHLDLTLGMEPSPGWLTLTQVYAGQADGAAMSPRWLKLEISAVRSFGDWRLQAGWRESVAGRDSPAERGLVFAVWRSF
ncbi:MAG: hypothetical protein HY859_12735 [Caulobacterales bacterium]|nr:hypothetical protein [Caulobacterales bacterium]